VNVTLLEALRRVAGDRPFTFVSEWLGYLPYGQYCHFELDGIDITQQLPPWEALDVMQLVADGHLVELSRQTSNDTDSRTVYRLA
jgi:hypothetical protein